MDPSPGTLDIAQPPTSYEATTSKWDNYSTFIKENGEVYLDGYLSLGEQNLKPTAGNLQREINLLDTDKNVSSDKVQEYLSLHNSFYDKNLQPTLPDLDMQEESELRNIFFGLLQEKTQEMKKPAYEPQTLEAIKKDFYKEMQSKAKTKTEADVAEIIGDAEEQGITYTQKQKEGLSNYILHNRTLFYLANASNYEQNADKIFEDDNYEQFTPAPLVKIAIGDVEGLVGEVLKEEYNIADLARVIRFYNTVAADEATMFDPAKPKLADWPDMFIPASSPVNFYKEIKNVFEDESQRVSDEQGVPLAQAKMFLRLQVKARVDENSALYQSMKLQPEDAFGSDNVQVVQLAQAVAQIPDAIAAENASIALSGADIELAELRQQKAVIVNNLEKMWEYYYQQSDIYDAHYDPSTSPLGASLSDTTKDKEGTFRTMIENADQDTTEGAEFLNAVLLLDIRDKEDPYTSLLWTLKKLGEIDKQIIGREAMIGETLEGTDFWVQGRREELFTIKSLPSMNDRVSKIQTQEVPDWYSRVYPSIGKLAYGETYNPLIKHFSNIDEYTGGDKEDPRHQAWLEMMNQLQTDLITKFPGTYKQENVYDDVHNYIQEFLPTEYSYWNVVVDAFDTDKITSPTIGAADINLRKVENYLHSLQTELERQKKLGNESKIQDTQQKIKATKNLIDTSISIKEDAKQSEQGVLSTVYAWTDFGQWSAIAGGLDIADLGDSYENALDDFNDNNSEKNREWWAKELNSLQSYYSENVPDYIEDVDSYLKTKAQVWNVSKSKVDPISNRQSSKSLSEILSTLPNGRFDIKLDTPYSPDDPIIEQLIREGMTRKYSTDLIGNYPAVPETLRGKILYSYLNSEASLDEIETQLRSAAQTTRELEGSGLSPDFAESYAFARQMMDVGILEGAPQDILLEEADVPTGILGYERLRSVKKFEIPANFQRYFPGEADDTIQEMIESGKLTQQQWMGIQTEAARITYGYNSQRLMRNFGELLMDVTMSTTIDSQTYEIYQQPTFLTWLAITGMSAAEEMVAEVPVTFTDPTGLFPSYGSVWGGGKQSRDEYWAIRAEYFKEEGFYRETEAGELVGFHPMLFLFDNPEYKKELYAYIDKMAQEEYEDGKIEFSDLHKYTMGYLDTLVADGQITSQQLQYLKDEGFLDDVRSIYGKGLAMALTGYMDYVPFSIGTPAGIDYFLQEEMPADMYFGTRPQELSGLSGWFTRYNSNLKSGEPPGLMEGYAFPMAGLGYQDGTVYQDAVQRGTMAAFLMPVEEIVFGGVLGVGMTALKSGKTIKAGRASIQRAYRAGEYGEAAKRTAMYGLVGALEGATPYVEFLPGLGRPISSAMQIGRGAIVEGMVDAPEGSAKYLRDADLVEELEETISAAPTFQNIVADVAKTVTSAGIGYALGGVPGALFTGLFRNPASKTAGVNIAFGVLGMGGKTARQARVIPYYYQRTASFEEVTKNLAHVYAKRDGLDGVNAVLDIASDPSKIKNQARVENIKAEINAKQEAFDTAMKEGRREDAIQIEAEVRNLQKDLKEEISSSQSFEKRDLFEQLLNRVGITLDQAVLHFADLSIKQRETMDLISKQLMANRKILQESYSGKLKNLDEKVLLDTLTGREELVIRSDGYKRFKRAIFEDVNRGIIDETEARVLLAHQRIVAAASEAPRQYFDTVSYKGMETPSTFKHAEETFGDKAVPAEEMFELFKASRFEEDAYFKSIGLYEFIASAETLTVDAVKAYKNKFENYNLIDGVEEINLDTNQAIMRPPSERMKGYNIAHVRIGNKNVYVYYKQDGQKLTIGEIHHDLALGDDPVRGFKADAEIRSRATKKLFSEKLKENIYKLEWVEDDVFYQVKPTEANQRFLDGAKDLYRMSINEYLDSFYDSLEKAKAGTNSEKTSRQMPYQVSRSVQDRQGIKRKKGTIRDRDEQESLPIHPGLLDSAPSSELPAKVLSQQLDSVSKSRENLNKVSGYKTDKIQEEFQGVTLKEGETGKEQLAELKSKMKKYFLLFDNLDEVFDNYAKGIEKVENKAEFLDRIKQGIIGQTDAKIRSKRSSLNRAKTRAEQRARVGARGLQVAEPNLQEIVQQRLENPTEVPEPLQNFNADLETALNKITQEGFDLGLIDLDVDTRNIRESKVYRGLSASERIVERGNSSLQFRNVTLGDGPAFLLENISTGRVSEIQQELSRLYFMLEQAQSLKNSKDKTKQIKSLEKRIDSARKKMMANRNPDLADMHGDARQALREILTSDELTMDYIGYQSDNLLFGSILRSEFKLAGIEFVEHRIKDQYGTPYNMIEISDRVRNKMKRDSLPVIDRTDQLQFLGIETKRLHRQLDHFVEEELPDIQAIGEEKVQRIKLDNGETLSTRYLDNMRRWLGLTDINDPDAVRAAVVENAESISTIRDDMFSGYSRLELMSMLRDKTLGEESDKAVKAYLDHLTEQGLEEGNYEFVKGSGVAQESYQYSASVVFDFDPSGRQQVLEVTGPTILSEHARTIVYMATQEGFDQVVFKNPSEGTSKAMKSLSTDWDAALTTEEGLARIQITPEMRNSTSVKKQPLYMSDKKQVTRAEFEARYQNRKEVLDQMSTQQKRETMLNMRQNPDPTLFALSGVEYFEKKSFIRVRINGKLNRKKFSIQDGDVDAAKAEVEAWVRKTYLLDPKEELIVGSMPISRSVDETIQHLHQEPLEHMVIHKGRKIKRVIASKKSNSFDSKAFIINPDDPVFKGSTVVFNRSNGDAIDIKLLDMLVRSGAKELVITTPTRTVKMTLKEAVDSTDYQTLRAKIVRQINYVHGVIPRATKEVKGKTIKGEFYGRSPAGVTHYKMVREIATAIQGKIPEDAKAMPTMMAINHAYQEYLAEVIENILPAFEFEATEHNFNLGGSYARKPEKHKTGSVRLDASPYGRELKKLDAARRSTDPKERSTVARRRKGLKERREVGKPGPNPISIQSLDHIDRATQEAFVITNRERMTFSSQSDWERFFNLGAYDSMPKFIEDLSSILSDQLIKIVEGNVKPSEVLAAYFITVASQQAKEISVELLQNYLIKQSEEKGDTRFLAWNMLEAQKTQPSSRFNLDFMRLGGKDKKVPQIRAEEAVAAWFISPKGREALERFDELVSEDLSLSMEDISVEMPDLFGDVYAIRDAWIISTPTNNLNAYKKKPKKHQASGPDYIDGMNFVELVEDILLTHEGLKREGSGYSKSFRDDDAAEYTQLQLNSLFKQNIDGVGAVKSPFMAQLLGFGAMTTTDAQERYALLQLFGEVVKATPDETKIREINNQALRNLNKFPGAGLYTTIGTGLFNKKTGEYQPKRLIEEFQTEVQLQYSIIRKKLEKKGIFLKEEHWAAIIHQWCWARMKKFEESNYAQVEMYANALNDDRVIMLQEQVDYYLQLMQEGSVGFKMASDGIISQLTTDAEIIENHIPTILSLSDSMAQAGVTQAAELSRIIRETFDFKETTPAIAYTEGALADPSLDVKRFSVTLSHRRVIEQVRELQAKGLYLDDRGKYTHKGKSVELSFSANANRFTFLHENAHLLEDLLTKEGYEQLTEVFESIETADGRKILTLQGREDLANAYAYVMVAPQTTPDPKRKGVVAMIRSAFQSLSKGYLKGRLEDPTIAGMDTSDISRVETMLYRNFNPSEIVGEEARLIGDSQLRANVMEAAKILEGPVFRGIDGIQEAANAQGKSFPKTFEKANQSMVALNPLTRQQQAREPRTVAKLRQLNRQLPNDELLFDLRPSQFPASIHDPTVLLPERRRAADDVAKRRLSEREGNEAPSQTEIEAEQAQPDFKVTGRDIDRAFLDLKNEGGAVDRQDLILRTLALVEMRVAQAESGGFKYTALTSRTIVKIADVELYAELAHNRMKQVFGVDSMEDLAPRFDTNHMSFEDVKTAQDLRLRNQPKITIDDLDANARLNSLLAQIAGTPGMHNLPSDLIRRIKSKGPTDIYLNEMAHIRDAIIDISVPSGHRRNKDVETANRHFVYNALTATLTAFKMGDRSKVRRFVDRVVDGIFENYTPSQRDGIFFGKEPPEHSARIAELIESFRREMRAFPMELNEIIDLIIQHNKESDIRAAGQILGLPEGSVPPGAKNLKPGMLEITRQLRRFLNTPVDPIHLPLLRNLHRRLHTLDTQQLLGPIVLEGFADAGPTLEGKIRQLDVAGVTEYEQHYNVLREYIESPRERTISEAESKKVTKAARAIDKLYNETFRTRDPLKLDELMDKPAVLTDLGEVIEPAKDGLLRDIDVLFQKRVKTEREVEAFTELYKLFEEYDPKTLLTDQQTKIFERHISVVYDGIMSRSTQVEQMGMSIYQSILGKTKFDGVMEEARGLSFTAYTLAFTGRITIGDMDIKQMKGADLFDKNKPPSGNVWTVQDLMQVARQYGAYPRVEAGEKLSRASMIKNAVEQRFDVKLDDIKNDPERIVQIANQIAVSPQEGMFESLLQLVQSKKKTPIRLREDTAAEFDVGEMIFEMIIRLMAEEKLANLSRKIAETHIYGDLRQVSRDRLIEMGFSPITHQDEFLEIVKEKIEGWLKTGNLNVKVIDNVSGRVYGTYEGNNAMELSAQEVASEIVYTYGLEAGEGGTIERFVAPDGEVYLIPKELEEDLRATLDDIAPSGKAVEQGYGSLSDLRERRQNEKRLKRALILHDEVKENLVEFLTGKAEDSELNLSEDLAIEIADQYLLETHPDFVETKRLIDEKKAQKERENVLLDTTERPAPPEADQIINIMEQQFGAAVKEYLEGVLGKQKLSKMKAIPEDIRVALNARANIVEALHTSKAISGDVFQTKSETTLRINSSLQDTNGYILNAKEAVGLALRIYGNKFVSSIDPSIVLAKPYNRWKKQAVTTGFLLPNFAYYINNFIGAIAQIYTGRGIEGISNLVGGIARNPMIFSRSFRILHGGAGGIAKADVGRPTFGIPGTSLGVGGNTGVFVTRDGRMYTAESLAAAADRNGIGATFIKAELARSIAEDIRRSDPNRSMGLLRIGRAANDLFLEFAQSTDNLFRLSMFMSEIHKGLSEAEAAANVRATFFDYADLTKSEKEVLREVFLFYAYMRKNQVQIFRALAENPSRVMGQLRFIAASQEQALAEDQDRRLLPDYMQFRLFLTGQPVDFATIREAYAFKDRVGNKIIMAPNLGVGDAIKLLSPLGAISRDISAQQAFSELYKFLAGQTALTPKMLIEFLSDASTFTDRELQESIRITPELVKTINDVTDGLGMPIFATASNGRKGFINLKLDVYDTQDNLRPDQAYYKPATPDDVLALYILMDLAGSFPLTSLMAGRGKKFYYDLLYKGLQSRITGEPIEVPSGYSFEDTGSAAFSFPPKVTPSATEQKRKPLQKRLQEVRENK